MSIYEDYGALTSAGAGLGLTIIGSFLIVFVITMILSIAVSVLLIISLAKIFKKYEKPWWYAIIPFLNMWTLLEITGYKGFWCLVPFANIVFMLMSYYKLGMMEKNSQGFAIFTALVPAIALPILAFSKPKTDIPNIVNNNQEVNNTMNNNINNTMDNSSNFNSNQQSINQNNMNQVNQPVTQEQPQITPNENLTIEEIQPVDNNVINDNQNTEPKLTDLYNNNMNNNMNNDLNNNMNNNINNDNNNVL